MGRVNEKLQSDLLSMAARDRRVRAELATSGKLFNGYHEEMAAVHEENADKLELIIERYGWPGIPLVGNEAAEAAWLILQHAIGRPRLQRKALSMLKAAADAGEAPATQLAYLEDRICVLEGRPQRYGTQFDWDQSGQLNPCPLEDPDHVDDFRNSVGLGPLAEKLEQIRRQAEAEGDTPPLDFEKRRQEAEDWAKSVGWR